MDDAVVVFTTSDADEVTERLVTALLERRQAACVQVVPMTSHYRWNGEIHHDAEQLLIVKTAADRADDVAATIAELHPYDEPEVLVVDATGGSDGYLSWLVDETRPR